LFLVIGAMLFTYYQHVPRLRSAGRRNSAVVRRAHAHRRRRGLHRRRHRRGRALAVDQFDGRRHGPRLLREVHQAGCERTQQMRLARQSTIGWGIVQIGVGLAAQWMDRSVLDAGLAVLSLASGPVLGAFLIGVLTKRVQTGAMLTGMVAGAAVLVVVWWTGAVAWTWYAFTGASVTAIVALVASLPSSVSPLVTHN
jgi:hypothetical protein